MSMVTTGQSSDNCQTFWRSIRISAWFFAALAMLALLTPPGATHDEWYHLGSIWCGHGERRLHCEERGETPDYGMGANVNLPVVNCKAEPTEVLNCPINFQGLSRPLVNGGLYPPFFYWTLSWFVVPSVEASVILVRLVSALLITLLLGVSIWLLPNRFRLVLHLVAIAVWSPTGLFLFASVNPSAWSAAGISIGWLSFLAALGVRGLSLIQRTALATTGFLGFAMAGGSRWDSLPMIFTVVTTSIFYLGWQTRPQWRWKLLLMATSVTGVIVMLLARYSPFLPLKSFRSIYSYTEGQPDNFLFFSYNLTQALPNALRAVGTVSSLSFISIPKLVYVGGLLLLFYVMSQVKANSSKWQIAGSTGVVIAMAVMIMTQVANNDYRDIGSVEPRYVYPLLLFGVGWWFLQSSDESFENLRPRLRLLSMIAVALFTVSIFTISERYVDRQSFGVRLLPDGPDQWWWSWLPVGPNVLMVFAPICLWKFFCGLRILDEHHSSQFVS